MTHHVLKIEDCYYDAKVNGDKPFEVRLNDRGFQKGDLVSYTTADGLHKRAGLWKITYVTHYGQSAGYCVFAELRIDDDEG